MKNCKRRFWIKTWGIAVISIILFSCAGFASQTITVIDSLGRKVTLPYPVKTCIVGEDKFADYIKILGVEKTVVGIEEGIPERGCFSEMEDKPIIGGAWQDFNYEKIAQLNPDVVILMGHAGATPAILGGLEKIGVKALCVDPFLGEENKPLDVKDMDLTADKQVQCLWLLGKIFGREEKAQQFLNWRKEKIDIFMNRLKNVTEEEKPRVCLMYATSDLFVGDGKKEDITLDMAGLRNVMEIYGQKKMSPEWILKKRPGFYYYHHLRNS